MPFKDYSGISSIQQSIGTNNASLTERYITSATQRTWWRYTRIVAKLAKLRFSNKITTKKRNHTSNHKVSL